MAGGGGDVLDRQHGHAGPPVESSDFRKVVQVHLAGAGLKGLLRFGAAAQAGQSPCLIAANGGQALFALSGPLRGTRLALHLTDR